VEVAKKSKASIPLIDFQLTIKRVAIPKDFAFGMRLEEPILIPDRVIFERPNFGVIKLGSESKKSIAVLQTLDPLIERCSRFLNIPTFFISRSPTSSSSRLSENPKSFLIAIQAHP